MPYWTCPKCKTVYCYAKVDTPSCPCLLVPDVKDEDKAITEARDAQAKAMTNKKPKFYRGLVDKNENGDGANRTADKD